MKGIKLNEHEEIVHTERGAVYPFVIRIVAGGILTIVPFFFFFPLLAFGGAGMMLLFIVAGVGAYVLLRASSKWKGSVCIVTNQRIIQTRQKGLLDRQVTYASLKNINDIAYRISGLGKSVLRIGEVRVTFSGVIPSMLFANIKHPETLRDIIVELQSMPKMSSGSTGKGESFKRVHVDV
ncbi:MAG TPA: hypothetical protein QF873_02865 [Patescibacteria group bacterium]|nr:hypothetical protein [Patescibacteria group bacterium]